MSVLGGTICQQIQGRSAKFGHQIPVLGGTSAGRSRVDLPNLASRCQYWGVHLPADLGQICQIQLLVVSTGWYICWQIQGRSAKFSHQVSAWGETSAGRSRVDLPNLGTRCQQQGVHLPADVGQFCQIWPPDISTRWVHLLADLGQICQIQALDVSTWVVHLLADLGQICQIWPLDVSTGGNICWQIQGRSAKFSYQVSVLGGTSAGRSRVDLPNLATRCQYWGVHLLADLGQICQIWPAKMSVQGGNICQQIQGRSAIFRHQMSVAGQYICWQIQGSSAKFGHQMSVLGVHLLYRSRVDLLKFSGQQMSVQGVHLLKISGQIWQIWVLNVSTMGLHQLADLGQICQNLATRCQQLWVHLPADVGQFCQI